MQKTDSVTKPQRKRNCLNVEKPGCRRILSIGLRGARPPRLVLRFGEARISVSLSRRIEAPSLLTGHFTKTHYWAPVSTVTLAA